MEHTPYVLEMHNIVKVFPGVKALDDMNLRVRPGAVHVIVGENGAGKSTLMKIITGAYQPDGGEVIYRGKRLQKRTIQQSIEMGISMIHQELSPILDMTVAENIYVGHEPQRIRGVVDFKGMYRQAGELLERLGIKYPPGVKMRQLSVAGQQLIEIAKAINRKASLIIMDEPSSAITGAEVEILFRQIALLKEQGIAILYITHKMDEIFRIADDITVIRDGKWISSGPAGDYDVDRLISLMVGRSIANIFPKEFAPIGAEVLEVRGLTGGRRFRDVSFAVRRGEVLGFAGLVGAGRSEVMQAIFGLDPLERGEILLEGKPVSVGHTADAIQGGIAMITEDRRTYGIIPDRPARENISLSNLKKYRKGLSINTKQELEDVKEMIRLLSIKVATPEQRVKDLSGGNQQKVIIAKWLLMTPKVLILDEPTRGIDVGAKSEIHHLMCQLAQKGLAIIMISSELPEILGMSDRIIVMQEGHIQGVLAREDATQESIMALATKGVQE